MEGDNRIERYPPFGIAVPDDLPEHMRGSMYHFIRVPDAASIGCIALRLMHPMLVEAGREQ